MPHWLVAIVVAVGGLGILLALALASIQLGYSVVRDALGRGPRLEVAIKSGEVNGSWGLVVQVYNPSAGAIDVSDVHLELHDGYDWRIQDRCDVLNTDQIAPQRFQMIGFDLTRFRLPDTARLRAQAHVRAKGWLHRRRIFTSTPVVLGDLKTRDPAHLTGWGVAGSSSASTMPLAAAAASPQPGSSPTMELYPLPFNFIGRRVEIDSIMSDLASHRHVVVVGEGTVGKTSLARHVAWNLRRSFRDGVRFVSFEEATDAVVAERLLRSALLPEGVTSQLEPALVDHFATRECLVILDNCDAYAALCGSILMVLLRGPAMKVIATSQRELGRNLQHRRVGGMDRNDALKLLIDKIKLHDPDFSVTTDNQADLDAICSRRAGIPGLLELAALERRVRSIHDLATDPTVKLDPTLPGDDPSVTRPDHLSLRASVQHSYDRLLDEQGRTLHSRLSIFNGSFSRDAALTVCAKGNLAAQEPIGATLLRFEENSMIEAVGDPRRYRLSPRFVAYGRERLAERGETDEYANRHLGYYIEFAREQGPRLRGPDLAQGLDALASEEANFDAALSWARDHDPRGALDLASTLGDYWLRRGYLTFGRAQLRPLLPAQPSSDPVDIAGLIVAGHLAANQGDYAEAKQMLTDAVQFGRDAGNAGLLARALCVQMAVLLEASDYEGSQQIVEKARQAIEQADDPWSHAFLLNNLGRIAARSGRGDEARVHYEQSLREARAVGDPRLEAAPILNLAILDRGEHQLGAAEERLVQVVAILRRLGDRRATLIALDNLSRVAGDSGDRGRAVGLAREAAQIAREIQCHNCLDEYDLPNLAFQLMRLGEQLGQVEPLIEARETYKEMLARCRRDRERIDILVDLSDVEMRLEAPKEAIHYLEQVLDLLQHDGHPRDSATLLQLFQIHAALEAAYLAGPLPDVGAATRHSQAKDQAANELQLSTLLVHSRIASEQDSEDVREGPPVRDE